MAIVKYERVAPGSLTSEQRATLLALTDEAIQAGADPDDKPLAPNELLRLKAARLSREIRDKTGLTQTGLAAAYRIDPARLQDIEQGRVAPDPVLVAYLALIQDDPERARAILERAGG